MIIYDDIAAVLRDFETVVRLEPEYSEMMLRYEVPTGCIPLHGGAEGERLGYVYRVGKTSGILSSDFSFGLSKINTREYEAKSLREAVGKTGAEREKKVRRVLKEFLLKECDIEYDPTFANPVSEFDGIYAILESSDAPKTPREIRRPSAFPGIDELVYFKSDDGLADGPFSFFEMEEMDVDLETLWFAAWLNTKNSTVVNDLNPFVPGSDDEDAARSAVISSVDGKLGAAGVMDRRARDMVSRMLDCDYALCMPSSVDEMILSAFDETVDIKAASEAVSQINRMTLPPEKVLCDRAFVISL